MATEQFLHLLEILHKTSKAKNIPWQTAGEKRVFRIGIGEGSVRLKGWRDRNDGSLHTINAYLVNAEGKTIDEYEATEYMNEDFKWLHELYQQAHATAVNLNHVVDAMMDDLESGRFRELPAEPEPEYDDIPF